MIRGIADAAVGGHGEHLLHAALSALHSGAGGDPAAMNSDQRKAEIGKLVLRLVTDGQLPQQDRHRLNQLVAAENGISPQEAQQRVDRAEQQATQAARQAEETARRAADTAASGASIAAFSIFAVMLLGAIASVLALGAALAT